MRITRPLVLACTVIAVAAATITALVGFRSNDATTETSRRAAANAVLGKLPEGPPRVAKNDGLVPRKEIKDLVASSTLVFVGTVIEESGSTMLAPQIDLSGHTVRFKVDELLRGAPAEFIDIRELDLVTADPYDVGKQYLVFSFETPASPSGAPAAWVTNAAYQGAFDVVEGDIAKNKENGTVKISEIKKLLKGTA